MAVGREFRLRVTWAAPSSRISSWHNDYIKAAASGKVAKKFSARSGGFVV